MYAIILLVLNSCDHCWERNAGNPIRIDMAMEVMYKKKHDSKINKQKQAFSMQITIINFIVIKIHALEQNM